MDLPHRIPAASTRKARTGRRAPPHTSAARRATRTESASAIAERALDPALHAATVGEAPGSPGYFGVSTMAGTAPTSSYLEGSVAVGIFIVIVRWTAGPWTGWHSAPSANRRWLTDRALSTQQTKKAASSDAAFFYFLFWLPDLDSNQGPAD